MKKRITCIVLSLATLAATAGVSDDKGLDVPRAEFAKYYRQIVGTDAPDGLVAFAIDPKVSKTGKDAYTIVSKPGRAVAPNAVTITGSNLRSVMYGLYDLLERRGGCHWFWDGDVVPKKKSIDLSGLNVREEAQSLRSFFFELRCVRRITSKATIMTPKIRNHTHIGIFKAPKEDLTLAYDSSMTPSCSILSNSLLIASIRVLS